MNTKLNPTKQCLIEYIIPEIFYKFIKMYENEIYDNRCIIQNSKKLMSKTMEVMREKFAFF